MPSHPDRVRQNYCEHEFKETWGMGEDELIRLAKICTKCHLIKDSFIPGTVIDIDSQKEGPNWDKKTADLSHIKQDIKETFNLCEHEWTPFGPDSMYLCSKCNKLATKVELEA